MGHKGKPPCLCLPGLPVAAGPSPSRGCHPPGIWRHSISLENGCFGSRARKPHHASPGVPQSSPQHTLPGEQQALLLSFSPPPTPTRGQWWSGRSSPAGDAWTLELPTAQQRGVLGTPPPLARHCISLVGVEGWLAPFRRPSGDRLQGGADLLAPGSGHRGGGAPGLREGIRKHGMGDYNGPLCLLWPGGQGPSRPSTRPVLNW